METISPTYLEATLNDMLQKIIVTILLVTIIPIISPNQTTLTHAQSSIFLEPFVSVDGTLDDSQLSNRWRFEGQADQLVSLVAQPTSGNLNPVLLVKDSNDSVLATNDDQQFGELTARLEGIKLPQDDTYTIEVYREGLEAGSTSGTYTLALYTGLGSISPELSEVDERVWLTESRKEAEINLPAINNSNQYIEIDIQLLAQAGAEVETTWALGPWQFVWSPNGRWQLLRLRVFDRYETVAQGIESNLSDLSLRSKLSALLTQNSIQIYADDHLITEFISENVIIEGESESQLRFTVANDPDGSPSLQVNKVAYTQKFYTALSADQIAVPPIDASNRLFNYLGTPANIVNELEAFGLVPDGGGVNAVAPDGFIYTYAQGFSAYPLFGENTYSDFVVGFEAVVVEGTETTACGLIMRQEDGENFATAVFNPNQDLYFLNYEAGAPSADSITLNTPFINRGIERSNYFVIVAIGNEGTLYLNGRFIGTVELSADEGRFLVQLVLDQEIDSYCLLRELWVWEW